MGFAETLVSTYDLAIGRLTSGEAVHQFLADRAAARVKDLIASGSASPTYRHFVNGVEDAADTSLRIGSGEISYQFSSMVQATLFALNFCRANSPVDSGEYRDSWIILVNTVPFAASNLLLIPRGAEVAITNTKPYHRKIDVGGMRMSVPPQIIERCRQQVIRRYKSLIVERKFITFSGAYVLKGHPHASGLRFNKKSKAPNIRDRFVQIRPRALARRQDSVPGTVMTYPTLVMNEAR